MTQRSWILIVVAVLAVVALAVVVSTRSDAPPAVRAEAPAHQGLVLLVVRTDAGPQAAVLGSTGFGKTGALILPPKAVLTVPGQGEATLGEALGLPPRQAATAAGNLLGVWVDHYAVVDAEQLASVVDRAVGVEVAGEKLGGEDVIARLADPATDQTTQLQLILEGLLASGAQWRPGDLSESDGPAALQTLTAANGSRVVAVPTEEVASGVFQARSEQVSGALVDAFAGPEGDAVSVIVLNGNGVPGIGERVAEKILSGGFRIVVSENASSFDHEQTLVVVGSADDVALGERVRDLLGVGSVSVSVRSGIAPVTIVVGKDFVG